MANLLVLAKEPQPGRVKTRLSPPCSPLDAALLAEAALADTLAAARGSSAEQVVVALDGQPGAWLPPGVAVIPQGSGRLDQRLATAWSQMQRPTLQIGMDTPQLTSEQLDRALSRMLLPHVDAVFGPATDGGWWTVGMTRPDPQAFLGIPTSRPDTGARQRAHLESLGLRIFDLPEARDVDDIEDARAVAAEAPSTRFARTLQQLGHASVHVPAH